MGTPRGPVARPGVSEGEEAGAGGTRAGRRLTAGGNGEEEGAAPAKFALHPDAPAVRLD
jgi:hypothetical protein